MQRACDLLEIAQLPGLIEEGVATLFCQQPQLLEQRNLFLAIWDKPIQKRLERRTCV